MDRAEIVEGLKGMLSDSLVRLPEREELCVRHSIALLEPQPVTEDTLRKAGFDGESDALWLHLPAGQAIQYSPADPHRWYLHPADYDDGDGKCDWVVDRYAIPLPGITDMQQLHAVIAALKGWEC